MYAQLIEDGTTPDRRAQMDRTVVEEMVPALEAEPGFAGALNLVDRDSDNAMMIVLWDTESQARRALAEYGGAFLKALAASRRSRPGPAARSRSRKSTRAPDRRRLTPAPDLIDPVRGHGLATFADHDRMTLVGRISR